MASIDKRIVAALLTAMRSRRQDPWVSRTDATGRTPEGIAPAKVREARFSDFEAVADLKQRWGLAADSIENWERLWRRNPALAHTSSAPPIGWVLEAEGKVVAYLGNIWQLYRYGDKTLTSVTAHGFVADPQYRGSGVSLSAAYFRQKSVDLFISTGAIAPVAKIGRVFKSEGLSQPEYETALFWVLQPYPFAQVVMKKLSLRPALAGLGSILGSLAVATDRIVRRRRPRRSSANLEITEISVSQIGDEFQDLWLSKVNEKLQLLAERTPATLRWHFEVPGDTGTVRVLCCSRKGKLLGYMVVRDEPPDESNLRKSTIADMLVTEDDAEVVEALLAAAYNHARQAGSHVLEVLGFPPSVRRVWTQWRPYVRKYPSSPFLFKAVDPILHKAISDGATWYASPFDGDFTLIRPSYSGNASSQLETEESNRIGAAI